MGSDFGDHLHECAVARRGKKVDFHVFSTSSILLPEAEVFRTCSSVTSQQRTATEAAKVRNDMLQVSGPFPRLGCMLTVLSHFIFSSSGMMTRPIRFRSILGLIFATIGIITCIIHVVACGPLQSQDCLQSVTNRIGLVSLPGTGLCVTRACVVFFPQIDLFVSWLDARDTSNPQVRAIFNLRLRAFRRQPLEFLSRPLSAIYMFLIVHQPG